MTRSRTPAEPDGATPLDENENVGLIPSGVRTQGELNEWEQANIAEALRWLDSQRRSLKRVLSERFLLEVHRRMFGLTWEWAGTYRRSEKNIGVPWSGIRTAVRELLADTEHQLDQQVLPEDEIVARFHHRLVAVHPFPNGNGRHARFMADELLRSLGRPPFTWGRADRDAGTGVRDRYLNALRAADRGDFRPLLRFVRGHG